MVIAVIFSGIATWASSRYLLTPVFDSIGWGWPFWCNIILFFLCCGTCMEVLTRSRAESNLAYGNVTVKVDSTKKYCPKCGANTEAEDNFCQNCGVFRGGL